MKKNDFSLDSLKDMLEDKEPAESLEKIMTTVKALSAGAYDVVFDLSLVRGQGYYTQEPFLKWKALTLRAQSQAVEDMTI
ncbi:MAG: hypothetical protein ACLU70_12690 [Lachnospira sp.]